MRGGSVFKTNNRTHKGRNPHIRLSSSTSQKLPTGVFVREPAPARTRNHHGTKLLHIGETGPHSGATRPTR